MAGTFSQIYIQYVFAVKGRENQKPIVVNEVADHVHVFVGLKPYRREQRI